MWKIKALNQESSSDEDIPTIRREAQEEIALELYNNALRALSQKEYDKSASVLKQLIETNIPQLEINGSLPKLMSKLQYSCYVNLGNIYVEKERNCEALECFTKASELDSTDVTLWAKLGKLALKENKFNKAAYAFHKGLECSESHWPCLDNLISVLYAIKDTISCLFYIGKALALDTDYIKGIVLRKQIYRNNPAAKEYYQLYNEDHIYEPQVNEEVDKEEEEEILKDAELLCNRVTEAEKSVGFKPFETIALPKTLEDYTWLSLTKCITYCHQYITDHNMSHFTMFDISKCMSQSGDSGDRSANKSPGEASGKDSSKSIEGKSSENVSEEKMDTEPVVSGRRFSQVSDMTNGNDNFDNTPSQTDNDEEQNMELEDNETDGDNQDALNALQQSKKSKRKRDVLSDLQIWGWHSKRKPPKKIIKDYTVEDAINRIIPKNVLLNKVTKEICIQKGEDSMDTMDIYNMYVEDKELNFLSPIHSPKSVNSEEYFGTDRESYDVLNFWTKKRIIIDAVVLVKELVLELAKLWRHKWPKELIPLYIQLFKMFREHCDRPELFCSDLSPEQLKEDALATLLYGELLAFSSETNETVSPFILSYLQVTSGRSADWKDEFSMFSVRFFWLWSHCFRKNVQNELAIGALQVILEEVAGKNESEKFALNLPNCLKYGFISVQVIDKIIKHLNMIISLENIESLFNQQKYTEVAEVLKDTFHSGSYSKVGRMGRPAQLGILMHSLWFINWEECFVWTEECLHEAVTNWHRINIDQDKWELIIDKCLGFCQEIIKKETVCVLDKLTEEKRCRLVESLAQIVCKQINTDNIGGISLGNIEAWIVLHYALLREEQRQYGKKRMKQSRLEKYDVHKEEELPGSIAILFSAHEFLGPKGWCLTGKGELLHFILDTILERLDTPVLEPFRSKLDIHIEQALFCLYLYPSKKNKISRHLVDHNVNPIPLSWERSFQLYQYYAPESLPEFNSYKSQSISADLEQLFRRIIDLVPSSLNLQEQLLKIENFIQGKTDVLPEPVEFPAKVKAIYYLLGDYYFKEREFARCIKYYQLDVSVNPLRLDAWAALGLSYAAQLENSLNHCEKLKNESDFFDKAKSAQICFRKALELDPENLVLWIECGSFEYLVHSFCSRLIKFESENFSMEKFELLETQKDSYLDSSGCSLEHAIALYAADDSNEPDERWLQYYLLGKIAEKKRKEPTEYLQHYLRASTLLHENKATYPNKISYNNPQHLSVEALELHYRIHASILKYLELHEGKAVSNTLGAFFKKCLQATSERYDVVVPPPELPTKLDAPSTLSFQEQFVNSVKAQQADSSDIKACLDDILDKVARQEDPDVSIVETEDVVMIISDSDEEVFAAPSKLENKKEEVTEVIQDVQSMLDKMMEATMMDTTKPNDLELNNSGGEHGIAENKTNNEPVNKDSTVNKEEVLKTKSTEREIKKTNEEDSDSSSSSSSSDSASSDSESDDSDNSSSSSSSGSTNENLSNSETLQLVDKCIEGLEKCITRLPQNYKALYRLAHLYFNYKTRKDYTKCKQLLLGEYKCKNDVIVNGLFSDRSSKNFFNGIWRIPSTEIDRPGSLAAHMNRCVSLMLQVLRNSNDTKTLMELCMQLLKVPDRDKIYIRDSDRTSYSKQAMDMCVQSFRSQIKNIPDMQKAQVIRLLHDIFKVFQRVQKYIPSKESVFSDLLCNSYKAYIKDGVSENANVLDLAIKFCQQHRPVEKSKPPAPVFASRGPGLTAGTALVLPTPSTLMAPQKPLKPSGVGRPRGRPPLPKVPGQIRQHRTKSPSSSVPYPWQSSMYGANFNYEYLKHYQDELIKQYSQNLNMTQLQQLSNYFTSGRLNTSAQTLTNQFLTSSNLLGTSNLLRPGGSTPLLDQAALQKMLSTSSTLSSLTPDQKKFLDSMLPSSFTSSVPTATSSAPASIFGTAKTGKSHTVVSSNKYPNVNVSETNVLMKDRPNISITPVTSTLSQTKPSSSKTHPVSSPLILSSAPTASKPPTTYKPPLPISDVISSTRMSHTSSSATFPPKFTATLQAPTAHSTISPKHAHTLPATPPPVSSPSYMKTSTSPGKTLQQKLAEKKKEQETKQMMQNIESEIFATKLPPAPSVGLLKSLNIPSSLTVSPSGPPKMPEKPPGTSYSNFSASHLMGHVGDLKMPPSLTVSQSMPQPLYAPKFPADSGVSVSQVSNADSNKAKSSPKKQLGTDVSALKKICQNQKKTTNLPSRSGPIKCDLQYRKSLNPNFREGKSSSSRRKDNHQSSGKPHKLLLDKSAIENQALSVIKNLSSIDITPVSSSQVDKSKIKEGKVEEDVIVLD